MFVYDPEVPVLAPGGLMSLSGPADQSALEMGNNVLVYTSAPVTEQTEIFGHPRVSIYAITSAGRSDFTAKLVHVTTDGRAEFVSIGIARSCWLFAREAYRADAIQKWEFELEPTSLVVAVGESIRLEIASSAFPLYDRNSSSLVKPQMADAWTWQRSTQQVLHTVEHPSALYVPIVEGCGW